MIMCITCPLDFVNSGVAVAAAFAKSSSPAGKDAHSQLAERQQNSRLRRSNIATVCPLALLPSLLLAVVPAEIASPASATMAMKRQCTFPIFASPEILFEGLYCR